MKSVFYNRRHGCSLDNYVEYMFVSDYQKNEYYRLDAPYNCPFEFEHRMYEMNVKHEEKKDSIWFKPWMGRKRICQHCGTEIPNKSKCPNCGMGRYLYFELKKDSLLLNVLQMMDSFTWIGKLIFVGLMSMLIFSACLMLYSFIIGLQYITQ